MNNDLILGLLYGLLYLPVGIALMTLVDSMSGRVTRFIGDKTGRPWLVAAFWPVVLPMLALPRYRVRRGAELVGKGKPFVRA